MINRFNKIVENVFIPADDDDVKQRREEYAIIKAEEDRIRAEKNRIKREEHIKAKKKFELKFGKLKIGDVLVYEYSSMFGQKTNHYYIVKNIKLELYHGKLWEEIIYVRINDNTFSTLNHFDNITFSTHNHYSNYIDICDNFDGVLVGVKHKLNLKENVFIPADNDEIEARKIEHKKKIIANEPIYKTEFLRYVGKLRDGDVLRPTDAHGTLISDLGDWAADMLIIKAPFIDTDGIPKMIISNDYTSFEYEHPEFLNPKVIEYPYNYLMDEEGGSQGGWEIAEKF